MRIQALFSMIVVWGLMIAACTGPHPQASEPRVLPPSSPGGPYQVALVVRNLGSGEGQVELKVRLRERAQGKTYVSSQKLELRGHESVNVLASVPAPPGDYAAEAEVIYPPG